MNIWELLHITISHTTPMVNNSNKNILRQAILLPKDLKFIMYFLIIKSNY